MPNICIIIINWNGYDDTSELLHSLIKVQKYEFKVFVVDNNSLKEDADKLETNFEGFIKVIRCQSNLGFAGGNNVGIQKALEEDADFILLINNDTTVEPDFLTPLLNVFNNMNEAGIVAPIINYYHQKKKIWTEGGWISRIRGSGFAYSDRSEDDGVKENKTVSFVSGCCMLIKKEVFETVGLFDDFFFLYVEDTDFCYRVGKAGYKIIVSHDSKIFHKIRSSTNNNFLDLPLYYTTRNRLYFARKNFRSSYLITFFYLLFVMFLKSIYWFFTGRFNNIVSVSRAFRDFYTGKMGQTDHKKFKQDR